MTIAEFATRATIWIALGFYFVGAAMQHRAGRRLPRSGAARMLWSLGCAFYIAHVICAFAFYHHWSHSNAYQATAKDTLEVTGWNWGGGLYLNYLFSAAWLADVVWWWSSPKSWLERPRWLHAGWHAFFLFLVFNATVVFEEGLARLAGIILCTALLLVWARGVGKVQS